MYYIHNLNLFYKILCGTTMSVFFNDKQLFVIQSTLFISKSKGLSEILRDIPASKYQICRIEEKINRTATFHKWICSLTAEVRDILKILWKRGEIAHYEQFLLFSTILCYLLLDFHVKTGTRF